MYHSRALILRKEGWGESDLRLTALSADFGKIRLMAQGARKHGAKLQSHLEPGSVSDISFVIGRNGYRLTTARLNVFPTRSWNSLDKLSALMKMLVTLDRNLLEEKDNAAELLQFLEELIAALEATESTDAVRRLGVWFHARLAVFLGIFPSPRSPEARSVFSLAGILAYSPAAAADADLPPETLERELDWLIRHLGGVFFSAGTVSVALPGLY